MSWPQSAGSCRGDDSLEIQLMAEILDCNGAPARRHVTAEVQRSEKQLILDVHRIDLPRGAQDTKCYGQREGACVSDST